MDVSSSVRGENTRFGRTRQRIAEPRYHGIKISPSRQQRASASNLASPCHLKAMEASGSRSGAEGPGLCEAWGCAPRRTYTMTEITYDTDFHAWTQAQAEALRAKDWNTL